MAKSEKLTFTKSELIAAFKKYNADHLANPSASTPLNTSDECAKQQAEYLLYCLSEVKK